MKFFLILIFFVPLAHALPGVYYGKIEKEEFRMVVEMKSKKNLKGNYYFFKKPKDIFIFGRVYDENTVLLEERIKNKFTGIFEFKIDREEDNKLVISEGFWYSPDRKTKKKVRVTLVGLESEGNDQALYESLRPGASFDESEIRRGKSILKIERLRAGSQQHKFVLKSFRKPAAIQKINDYLKEWSAIDCPDAEYPETSWDGGINSQLQAKFWREDLVYLSRTATGYCPTSSHPLNGDLESVVYDLTKQKAIPFIDIFKDWPKDKSVIIRAIFPKQIEDFEKFQAATKITGNDLDNVGCESAQSLQEFIQAAEFGIDYEFNFAEKTLKVTRNFQNVSNVCNNVEVEIPLVKLEQQLRPEYLK